MNKKVIFSLSLTFLSVFLAIFAFQGFMHVYGILINENMGLMRMLPGFLLPYVCISALFFLLYPILVKEMSKKRKIIHSSIFFALELVLLILFLTEAKFHFSGFPTRTWTFLLMIVVLTALLILNLCFDTHQLFIDVYQSSPIQGMRWYCYALTCFFSFFCFGFFGDGFLAIFRPENYALELFFYPILLLVFLYPLISLVLTLLQKTIKFKYFPLINIAILVLLLILFLVILTSTQVIATVGQGLFFIDFAAFTYYAPYLLYVVYGVALLLSLFSFLRGLKKKEN